MWSTPDTIPVSIAIQFLDRRYRSICSRLRIAVTNRDPIQNVDQEIVDQEFRIATITCGPHSKRFRSQSSAYRYSLVQPSCPYFGPIRERHFLLIYHLESTNSKLANRFTTAAPCTDHRHTVLVIRASVLISAQRPDANTSDVDLSSKHHAHIGLFRCDR